MNEHQYSATSINRVDFSIKKLFILFFPFFVAFFIMAATSPYKAPLVLVPLPFVLVGFGIYRLINTAMRAAGLGAVKTRALSALASGSFTLILILKSIGQLTIRDFIIMMLLIAGFVFYVNRTAILRK